MSLGRVCVDDVVTRRVVVANEGELAFEAEWRVGLKNPRLAASPEFFSVAPGERKVCVLSYRPTKTETLRDGDAVLKIVNGRSYAFVLEADARKPALVFSAREVKFGDALVDRFGEAKYEPPRRDALDSSSGAGNLASRVLTLTNSDTEPVTVDCVFDPDDSSGKDPDARAFEVTRLEDSANGESSNGALAPGASRDFVVRFRRARRAPTRRSRRLKSTASRLNAFDFREPASHLG